MPRGRVAGTATALGIGVASSVQTVLVSFGIGSVIVAVQPLFETIPWLGVAYLLWSGIGALRSAVRGTYTRGEGEKARGPLLGFRDDVVCNITNPKILVFYLALMPQFVGAAAPVTHWILFATTVPAFGTLWLIGMALAVNQARDVLLRCTARRATDGASNLLLIVFGLRLSRET